MSVTTASRERMRVKLARLERLLATEAAWSCGGGDSGRNKGTKRAAKKLRAHHARMHRMENTVKVLKAESGARA